MNRKELEEAIRQLQLLYAMSSSKAIEDGIEAIRYQLAQMNVQAWAYREDSVFE